MAKSYVVVAHVILVSAHGLNSGLGLRLGPEVNAGANFLGTASI